MEISFTEFSTSIGASIFKFCIHLQVAKCIVQMKIKMLILIMPSFFHFIIFSFCHLYHMGISSVKDFSTTTWVFFHVEDFSATTWVRILKFCTKLDSDKLNCVAKSSHILPISPFICSFFFLSKENFCHRFLGSYWSKCFKTLCTPSDSQSVLCKLKLRCSSSVCLLSSNFQFFLLSLLYITYGHFTVKDFSVTTWFRIIKFLTILSFLWKCYNLWWLPQGVFELCSLLAIFFLERRAWMPLFPEIFIRLKPIIFLLIQYTYDGSLYVSSLSLVRIPKFRCMYIHKKCVALHIRRVTLCIYCNFRIFRWKRTSLKYK